ncbi:MAG TPA: multidrug efflux SMR transporter [Myxococcaceae bacterium]|nr:multidrug efflux SMR transporter [Myxococcaceae bacterium]
MHRLWQGVDRAGRDVSGPLAGIGGAWLSLTLAGLLEVVWALALARSDGFTRPRPAAVAVSAAVASFLLLSFALRRLPVGTAYTVWVGIGAAGVVLAGIFLEGEQASWHRLTLLALLTISIIGLHRLGS